MLAIVVLVLALALFCGIAMDLLRDVTDRRERERYERASHARLLREIRRQP